MRIARGRLRLQRANGAQDFIVGRSNMIPCKQINATAANVRGPRNHCSIHQGSLCCRQERRLIRVQHFGGVEVQVSQGLDKVSIASALDGYDTSQIASTAINVQLVPGFTDVTTGPAGVTPRLQRDVLMRQNVNLRLLTCCINILATAWHRWIHKIHGIKDVLSCLQPDRPGG